MRGSHSDSSSSVYHQLSRSSIEAFLSAQRSALRPRKRTSATGAVAAAMGGKLSFRPGGSSTQQRPQRSSRSRSSVDGSVSSPAQRRLRNSMTTLSSGNSSRARRREGGVGPGGG